MVIGCKGGLFEGWWYCRLWDGARFAYQHTEIMLVLLRLMDEFQGCR
jgi:hypothetical protein